METPRKTVEPGALSHVNDVIMCGWTRAHIHTYLASGRLSYTPTLNG